MKMRKKWKNYKLEPTLDKFPPEMRVSASDLLEFEGRYNPDAKMVLTCAGYRAIMKKDGEHFDDCWRFVNA